MKASASIAILSCNIKWLDWLKRSIPDSCRIFDENSIETGHDRAAWWRRTLESADVIVLLLTQALLRERAEQLALIAELQRRDHRPRLYPVHCEATDLTGFPWLAALQLEPEKALSKMRKPQRDDALVRIAQKLRDRIETVHPAVHAPSPVQATSGPLSMPERADTDPDALTENMRDLVRAAWEEGRCATEGRQRIDAIVQLAPQFAPTLRGETALLLRFLIGLYPLAMLQGAYQRYLTLVDSALSLLHLRDSSRDYAELVVRAAIAAQLGCPPEIAAHWHARLQDSHADRHCRCPELMNLLHFARVLHAVHRQPQGAHALLERAIDYERERGASWMLAGFMGWQALLLCRTGSFCPAEEVAVQALQVARGNPRSEIFLKRVLIRALRGQNRLPEARAVFINSRSLQKHAEDPIRALLLMEHAETLHGLGDSDGADVQRQRSRQILARLGLKEEK